MSSEQETAQDIDDAAATWAVKADEHGSDSGVAAEIEAWLAGDRRRAGALLRAQAALAFIDRGRALAAPLQAAQPRRRAFARLNRREILIGGAVAGLAAAAGIAVVVSNGQRYETTLGEVRRVPLQDGSIATINTASQFDIALKPELRQIDLLQGEVWFKVAKDPERPFIVAAGPVRVRAVGTAFAVRRHETGADVLVTEGVVEAWVVGADDKKLRLTAGQKAFVPDHEPARVAAIDAGEIDRTLAWRNGQIALHGETLAYAVSEFNRYNSRKIVVADASLASQKLVGQFRTDEPEAFANAAAATLGAKVVLDGTTIRLARAAKR